jgi:hypothetical protein
MSFKLSELCGHHDTFYRFGRSLYKYTDCGPWVVAVLLDGTDIYYESDDARSLLMDTVVDHVRVGSIVEGSDVDVGPFEVHDPTEFFDTVQAVTDEASFYWRRDNTELYSIEAGGFDTIYFCLNWGAIEWEGGFPYWIRRTHRQAILKAVRTQDLPYSTTIQVGPWAVQHLDQGHHTY